MATELPIPEREPGITRAEPPSPAAPGQARQAEPRRFEWSAQDPMAYRRRLAADPRRLTR